MKKMQGFTLIELIIFIVVTAILANSILLMFSTSLLKTPVLRQQIIANQTAKQCMEWFVGQRRFTGYATLTCPSTPSPAFCSVPSGYAISNTITCTTLNGDANYKTITVAVSGLGDATLTSLISSY